MKIPSYSRAVLTRPLGPYETGRAVVVTEYIDPAKPGQEPGYAIEIGPWGEFGAPTDWTVVAESHLRLVRSVD